MVFPERSWCLRPSPFQQIHGVHVKTHTIQDLRVPFFSSVSITDMNMITGVADGRHFVKLD
jgi:hypothetical protein